MRKTLLKLFSGQGKISVRFRNINIAMFVVFAVLIIAVMLFVLQGITDTVSKDYAKLYSAETVGVLNTYFSKERALIAMTARSRAVIDWYMDEDNPQKKLGGYEALKNALDLLSVRNLYIGIDKTRHEFSLKEGFAFDAMQAHATLNEDYFDDAWYFNCINSDEEYLLNVDVDKMTNTKSLWINYKVTYNGDVIGVLCTGLEFPIMVGNLFAQYDNNSVRGLLIDEKGSIWMDSAHLGDDFLHYQIGEGLPINDEFSDPDFLSAMNAYLGAIDGFFDAESRTAVVELSNNQFRYATIAPIDATTWSVVTFYNSSSLFNITKLMPVIIIMTTLLIVFILATSFASSVLIFVPFGKLMSSLVRIKEHKEELVYGTDLTDEIGELANTIQDMKDSLISALSKVYYDALTGIYNRRFLEENLLHIVQGASRSKSYLSVIMLDVDCFKHYNDTYGHSMGDVCLSSVASVIKSSILRADDFVARYGGEEFVIVLPDTDEHCARMTANRILENLRDYRILHEQNAVSGCVTASIGITTGIADHTHTAEDYIKRADEALYLSKQAGRDRATFLPFV